MGHACFDVAIVGSAFGGSLAAMIARRMGRRVVLIERGQHPRFAIGESTTPLSNYLLEQLAATYDLPRLLPLTRWGAWQRSYPQIACGRKRGFSFFHHEAGRVWTPQSDRTNELLVAASPSDAIADTHWYRPDVDHWLQQEAVSMGAEYLDQTNLETVEFGASGVRLTGRKAGRSVRLQAAWLLDASGPRGFLSRALALPESLWTGYPATQGLFSHFEDVRRWDSLHDTGVAPPFPPDDAALHHVFDGGWVWVLRFQNGLTSAGCSARPELVSQLRMADGAAAWRRLLDRYPSLAWQFETARPVRGFTHQERMPYRCARMVGPGWALLPSAAGFVDPLMSTGFSLNLLGIARIALWMGRDGGPSALEASQYESATAADLNAAAAMIAALHHNLGRPAIFRQLALLYFAAAIYSETARRLGRVDLAPGFLLHGRPGFAEAARAVIRMSLEPSVSEVNLSEAVAQTIEPVNLAGLGRPDRRHWYPVDPEDLHAAASKVGATNEAIRQMLQRAGFEGDCGPGRARPPDLCQRGTAR